MIAEVYGGGVVRGGAMPKFVIERNIPGAGSLSAAELAAVSKSSCSVLRTMGPQIQWLESFVTDDKLYCIYIAPDEATVRQHAEMGGFPANSVAEVRTVIDPTFGD
jgi:hypothetical protein